MDPALCTQPSGPPQLAQVDHPEAATRVPERSAVWASLQISSLNPPL